MRWAASKGAWDPRPPAGRGDLPGAAQVEFVRRLAERRTASRPGGFEDLADLVLRRSGPGRGLGQLPLLWPGAPASGTSGHPLGAPPVDPARIPARELVRVGVGALVDLLLREPDRASERARRWRRPWSKHFRLAGAPTTAAGVRAALAAAGHVEGGQRPEVLLFAMPFERLMGQVWSARVQRGADVRWRTFMAKWSDKDRLPPSADLPAIARLWAERVGPGCVHVVLGPDDRAARRTAADVLGLRVVEPTSPPDLETLSAAGVQLMRRANAVLNVRVSADRRRGLVRRLTSLLHDEEPLRLTIPVEQQNWAQARSAQLAEQLSSGRYAVHGDLDEIVLRPPHATAHRTGGREVLDLTLATCLRASAQW
jgi:hypothetical protein